LFVFLVVAMVWVYDVEELAHFGFQVCSFGFDIMDMGVLDIVSFSSFLFLYSNVNVCYIPLSDSSKSPIFCSNFSLNLCMIAVFFEGWREGGGG
jgi:hypothetical protein